MSFALRRFASTGASANTRQLACDLLEKAQTAPPIVRKQIIDSNQLQRLSLTLNRPRIYSDTPVHGENGAPPQGTPLPPGYHLAYFTPAALPGELGADGTDISYSPAHPFTRRMWAGGLLKWEKDNPLAVGNEVTETTKLISAEAKVTRTHEEMIVIGVEKIFENPKGIALVDKRDWVFRVQLPLSAPARRYPPLEDVRINLPKPSDSSIKARDFIQTPVSLFRFSALTFNAHMIHYSRPWCQEMEGHKDLVVHGPLNLINMLDFWRDEQSEGGRQIPRSIRYRATAPFYVGEKYRALLEPGESTASVKFWGSDGKSDVRVGMTGDFVH